MKTIPSGLLCEFVDTNDPELPDLLHRYWRICFPGYKPLYDFQRLQEIHEVIFLWIDHSLIGFIVFHRAGKLIHIDDFALNPVYKLCLNPSQQFQVLLNTIVQHYRLTAYCMQCILRKRNTVQKLLLNEGGFVQQDFIEDYFASPLDKGVVMQKVISNPAKRCFDRHGIPYI